MKGVLKHPPDRWLPNSGLTHDQALLLTHPGSNTPTAVPLNPVILLPDPNLDQPLHDCLDILSHFRGIRPDLKGIPLSRAEGTWYTDGSNLSTWQ